MWNVSAREEYGRAESDGSMKPIERIDQLLGSWRKVEDSPRSESYPAELDFLPNGTYAGRAAPDSRFHPLWDSGSFFLECPGQVKISTANDAELSYGCAIDGESITFTDRQGREIRYRRI